VDRLVRHVRGGGRVAHVDLVLGTAQPRGCGNSIPIAHASRAPGSSRCAGRWPRRGRSSRSSRPSSRRDGRRCSTRKGKYSSSGPDVERCRSRAPPSAFSASPQDMPGVALVRPGPSGVTTSQIIRPDLRPRRSARSASAGTSWDPGIANHVRPPRSPLKPVIDEPSKPIPSFRAPSISLGCHGKALEMPLEIREPQQQVLDALLLDLLQHVPCAPRGSDVARSLPLDHRQRVVVSSPENRKKTPGRRTTRPKASSPRMWRKSTPRGVDIFQPERLQLSVALRVPLAGPEDRETDRNRGEHGRRSRAEGPHVRPTPARAPWRIWARFPAQAL